MGIMLSSLVIIDDLHFLGVALSPTKDDSPLLVDPDAVITPPVALQRPEAIARRLKDLSQLWKLGMSLKGAKYLGKAKTLRKSSSAKG